MVPFLNPITSQSQPLAGTSTKLFAVTGADGVEREHWTSIHRITFLACRHPMVLNVSEHKNSKGHDASTFDANGRATRFHQSPHDLVIQLSCPSGANSGATMFMGVSVNACPRDLLSIWWQPGKAMSAAQTEQARALFFDLAEAERMDLPYIIEEVVAAPGATMASSSSSGFVEALTQPPPIYG